MVVHGTLIGTPPFTAACRAGACPIPAPSTLPKITSSISFGFKLIESIAPFTAKPPN